MPCELRVHRTLSALMNGCRAAYLRLIMVAHPDKGGSREHFEEIQEAFQHLSSSMRMPGKASPLRGHPNLNMEPLHGGPGIAESSCDMYDVDRGPPQASEAEFVQQHMRSANTAFEEAARSLEGGAL